MRSTGWCASSATMASRRSGSPGGEPLVRRKLERLIEMLAYWDDLDLTLTTNGSLLKQKARDSEECRTASALP